MTNETAWRVIQVAFRTAAELQGLLPFLKQNCNEEEYKNYSLGVATAIDSINVELTKRVLSSHPEFERQIESDIAAFGRIV